MGRTQKTGGRKTAVITGSTNGLGLEATRQLAARGVRVIMTGRNAQRGQSRVNDLKKQMPEADISYSQLDLSSLEGISPFAQSLDVEGLDILINNAGVMGPQERVLTSYGQELQFGTNHLAHFLLTSCLLPALIRGRGRVITVASRAALKGRIHFEDLKAARHYDSMTFYRQSKLANLMFALSLDRLLRQHDMPVQSCAAHPGWTRTNMIASIPHQETIPTLKQRLYQRVIEPIGAAIFNHFAQDVADGVQPLLAPVWLGGDVGGAYFGPQKFGERNGPVGPAHIPASARKESDQKRLWQCSVEITGAQYPFTYS
ncbi:hypothetical protein CGLAMM_05145 [Acetobacteraceae bacterium EV16G]|uniref:Short-chain dehydrogenase n=1 Tax=Sorlinia euscelidii TaxID=3081148 RepID=A0ABU7U003_9PROT